MQARGMGRVYHQVMGKTSSTIKLSPTSLLVVACITTQLGGCAFMSRLLGTGADGSDLREASDAGDIERLSAICEGTEAASSPEIKTSACDRRQAILDRDQMLAGDCEGLAQGYADSDQPDIAYVEAAARRFVECNDYESLFEDVVHWGNGNETAQMLARMEADGIDVNAGWAEYVASHLGMAFLANENGLYIEYAARHINTWLEDAGHDEHCVAIAAAASGSEWSAQANFLGYLGDAGCDQGVDIMVELLTSKNGSQRELACEMLSDHGRSKDLEVLDIVARTDPHMVLNEVTRDNRVYAIETWPARTACTNAIGQIQIRAAQ